MLYPIVLLLYYCAVVLIVAAYAHCNKRCQAAFFRARESSTHCCLGIPADDSTTTEDLGGQGFEPILRSITFAQGGCYIETTRLGNGTRHCEFPVLCYLHSVIDATTCSRASNWRQSQGTLLLSYVAVGSLSGVFSLPAPHERTHAHAISRTVKEEHANAQTTHTSEHSGVTGFVWTGESSSRGCSLERM